MIPFGQSILWEVMGSFEGGGAFISCEIPACSLTIGRKYKGTLGNWDVLPKYLMLPLKSLSDDVIVQHAALDQPELLQQTQAAEFPPSDLHSSSQTSARSGSGHSGKRRPVD